MKKLLSISLAMLVLLSGMHLYIATHICRGEVTSTKVSFWAEEKRCGMEETSSDCPTPNSISSKCCQSDLDVFSTDNNFNLSSSQLKELSKNIVQIFDVPFQFTLNYFDQANYYSDLSPPDNPGLVNEVSLPSICIFRI